MATSIAAAPAGEEAGATAPTMAVHRVAVQLPGVRDDAAMVLVGGLLIGLAAAVRRAG